MTCVLGIGAGLKLGNHDPSASILANGSIVAAAEEERFIRQKHAKSELPFEAIDYCTKCARTKFAENIEIAFPLLTYPYLERRLADLLEHRYGGSPTIFLYEHHLCHAAASYLISGHDPHP